MHQELDTGRPLDDPTVTGALGAPVLRDAPSDASDEELDAVPWAHVTPRLRALDHDFCIRTTDVALGRYVERIFGSMAIPGRPATTYSFITTASAPWPYVLYADGKRLSLSHDGAYVFSYLTWHINRQVVERSPSFATVHAAAVERDGVTVLMPAAMEAGKTTLTAGLLTAGFRYLTDEAVGIDPDTGLAHPFPKPLSIDRGSWGVLADLRPAPEPALAPYMREQWHVPPSALGVEAVQRPVPVSLIVAPHYRAGAETILEPMSRAAMLAHVAQQTFLLSASPSWRLRTLADVVEAADCYRLTVGELGAACRLLETLVGQAPRTARRGGKGL